MSSLCGFPECHDMTLWNMTSRYLLLFSRLMILKTLDSRLINTYFLNKEWFLWPSFMLSCSYVEHVHKFWKIKSTATVEIKGILLTALWFSWSNMQYLSSNWVFGDWRQIWDSWRYFCVRQVSRSIYLVFRSVSLSNCVYNY